jgi:transposase InsO family protein
MVLRNRSAKCHGISERFACRVFGQHRSTQRKTPKTSDDEVALTADIIALALQYGRYGYRRITVMLRRAGWMVNCKRVARIWRREGLKVLQKQLNIIDEFKSSGESRLIPSP